MTFLRKMISHSIVTDSIAILITFAYILTTLYTTELTLSAYLPVFIKLFITILFLQYIIAPISCFFSYKNISKRITNLEKFESTEKERTILFEDLMQYPFMCGLLTFIYFIIATVLFAIFLNDIIALNQTTRIICILECIFGSLCSAIYAHKYCYDLCKTISKKIINMGIDEKYIKNKKYFGLTLNKQMIIYIIIPTIITGILNIFIVLSAIKPNLNYTRFLQPQRISLDRMFYICVLNCLVQIFLSAYYYKNFYSENKELTKTLEKINNTNLLEFNLSNSNLSDEIKYDLSDEIAYNLYLSNECIKMFRQILKKRSDISLEIEQSSQDLSILSNQAQSITTEESAGTKQILHTMEMTTILTQTIEDSIEEINSFAENAVSKVDENSKTLHDISEKMNSLINSNVHNIDKLKELNSKINNIWEVLDLINSLTDQIKIIAFNSELESTKAENNTEKFLTLSTGLRHFANNTIQKTKEIKDNINEIQNASEVLLISSKKNTKIINTGKNLITKLDNKLSKIYNYMKENSISSQEIKDLIYQQARTFEDVLSKLQEINENIQINHIPIETITESSDNLKKLSEKLKEEINLNKGENNEN